MSAPPQNDKSGTFATGAVLSVVLFLGSWFFRYTAEQQAVQANLIRGLPSFRVAALKEKLCELVRLNPHSTISVQCHVTGLAAPGIMSVSNPDQSIVFTQDNRTPAIMTKSLEYELFDTLRETSPVQHDPSGNITRQASYCLERSKKLNRETIERGSEAIELIDLNDTTELDRYVELVKLDLYQPGALQFHHRQDKELQQQQQQQQQLLQQQYQQQQQQYQNAIAAPDSPSAPQYFDISNDNPHPLNINTPIHAAGAPPLPLSPIPQQLHLFLPRSQIHHDLFKFYHAESTYLNNSNTVVNNTIVNNTQINNTSQHLNSPSQTSIQTSTDNGNLNTPRLVGKLSEEYYLPIKKPLHVVGEIFVNGNDPTRAGVRPITYDDDKTVDPIVSADDKETIVSGLFSSSRFAYWASHACALAATLCFGFMSHAVYDQYSQSQPLVIPQAIPQTIPAVPTAPLPSIPQ